MPVPQARSSTCLLYTSVAGLGEVDLILHDVAHADRRDHTVEDEADAADDGRGNGVDKRVKLGREAQNDGVDGREADNAGVVDLGEGENAGIFTIGGVGRACLFYTSRCV